MALLQETVEGGLNQVGENVAGALSQVADAVRGKPSRRGEPLNVYTAQPHQVPVRAAIQYINQQAGLEVFREAYHRRAADVIVRRIPWPLRREMRDRGAATNFATFIPASQGPARNLVNIVYIDTAGDSPARLAEFFRNAGVPQGPSLARSGGRQRKFGAVEPPAVGQPVTTVHELGHAAGLGHYDPGDPTHFAGYGDAQGGELATITTGGYDISEWQKQRIAEVLGLSPENVQILDPRLMQ